MGAWCVERPGPVIALAVLLAIVGAVGAASLKPNGEVETLVDRGSETFQDTERFYEKFGDEPIYVLVKADLEQLMLTDDLGRLLTLEACLAGTAPADQLAEGLPTPAVCNDLAEAKPAHVVFGPATFLNQAVEQSMVVFQEQATAAEITGRKAFARAYRTALRDGLGKAEAEATGAAAQAQIQSEFEATLKRIAVQSGLTGLPSLESPSFISSVVFDSRFTDGRPKSKFSFLFPSSDSALISVRLRPELTEDERLEAIGLIRESVSDPAFQIKGGSYVVSGAPVIADGLTREIESEVIVLLIGALAMMALVLALVFVPPLRLLPLVIGLVACALAFGCLALFGGSLTMASIAGLPILIGLAVDYAIQLQARFGEARSSGSSAVRSAVEAAAKGGPVIAAAMIATAAGFTVLLLSPIPMVRSFGLLLVAGIVLAFILAMTAGLAILSMSGGDRAPSDGRRRTMRRLSTLGGERRVRAVAAAAAIRKRVVGLGPRSLAASIAMPGKILVAATVLAVAGWVAGTRTEVISDFRELVPGNLPELKNVDIVEEETGSTGQFAVAVTGDEVTSPEVIAWMSDFRKRALAEGGAEVEFPTCREVGIELCPGPSLDTLFSNGIPDSERVADLLELIPAYFLQALIEVDPEAATFGDTAILQFGIRVMPFDEQKELIDRVRAQVDSPDAEVTLPDGVEVAVVGLPVLAADANAALGANRYLLTIAGLAAVALVLLLIYRSWQRALVPLIPVVLAPGWSALVLEGAGVPLNPMSATLGALVIAIATEFSVLLSSRYWEEREQGASVGESLRRSYSRTGAAVMASATTAIAGFAVLAVAAPIQEIFGGEAIRMLTQFGLVAVVDLLVALAGVLLVLPAVLVWAENDFAIARRTLGRLRRRGALTQADA